MIQVKTIERKSPKDQSKKFYLTNVSPRRIDIEQVAQNIVDETSLSETDVKGVLNALQRQMIKHLQEGNSVHLGDVGSFRITISSKGVTAKEDSKVENIKRVNVIYKASPRMRKALSVVGGQVRFQRIAEKEENPNPSTGG